MDIFLHHLYEYRKGLRRLILHTTHIDNKTEILFKLKKANIDNLIVQVSENKINVFFGDAQFLSVLKSFEKDCLSDFSDKEDFILGALLGYDLKEQCRRYMKRKSEKKTPVLMSVA
jgi:hypothetical protein